MKSTKSHSNVRSFHRVACRPDVRAVFRLLLLAACLNGVAMNLAAAETGTPQRDHAASGIEAVETAKIALHLNVRAYAVEDRLLLPTNRPAPDFSNYTGTNVGLTEIVRAASDLQSAYRNRGFPGVSVAITPRHVTNGIVTMTVFQGTAASQILVSGRGYLASTNGIQEVVFLPAMDPARLNRASTGTATNRPAPATAMTVTAEPMTPEVEALRTRMAELDALERKARARPKDTNPPPTQLIIASARTVDPDRHPDPHQAIQNQWAELAREKRRAQLFPVAGTEVSPSPTNGPVFEVKGYELVGNTLLDLDLVDLVLRPYIATNASFNLVRRALTDLQTVYRDRGFATVSVGLPPQQLTNGIVKVQVIQGRLSEIIVQNNRYFSSNNVMRALPSLHEDMIMTAPIFQAELDRANANQDRQIYPQIEPGLEEKTTLLRLNVKDQLPLHGKVEFNNQSSPGTPDLRVNASAVYNNLWQQEHSLGVQYSYSPGFSKSGPDWSFYDKPSVANYSAFYRLPLGNYGAVQDLIAASPTSFGYDEAARKFNLPPPSGRPELTFSAGRSTIDPGLLTLSKKTIVDVPGVISISEADYQQDLTINNNVGTRLNLPLRGTAETQFSLSGGVDYKTYELTSLKTNNFLFSIITRDSGGNPRPPIISTVASPNPPPDGTTLKELQYLPLSVRFDASRRDALGVTSFGLGISGNAWQSESLGDLQKITGSTKSKGHWIILNPSLSRDFMIRTNWTLSLHAEGQWATEPLISNEQFGGGGVGSVRGYSEGEAFGDTGFRTSVEIKTPPHIVGIIDARQALTIRGSVYMDYAQTSLLDPQGRPASVPLWGCGFGGVISLGSHWDGRFLFSWPLLETSLTSSGVPRFNFSLTGQF